MPVVPTYISFISLGEHPQEISLLAPSRDYSEMSFITSEPPVNQPKLNLT